MSMSGVTAIKTARELSEFPNSLSIEWCRVDKKNLYVSQCLKNRFFLIKSYETIVGIVDDQEADIFEIGKYSPTTSKQMTYLCRNRFSDCERKYVEGRV